MNFSSIEGGRSMREMTVMPDFFAVPEHDVDARDYIKDLIYRTRGIFASTGIDKDKIARETIAKYRGGIQDSLTKLKGSSPSLYNYYEWLYRGIAVFITDPTKVPDENFLAQVSAIVELAGITEEEV